MTSDGRIAFLEKKRALLSPVEVRVLDYILADPQKVAAQTIYQMAEALYVSTATISRTAQRLGFRGFQELKYHLLQGPSTTRTADPSQSFRQVTQQMLVNIEESFAQLAEQQVTQVLAYLENAQVVEVYGRGASAPLCQDFARKCTFLGKRAFAHVDWDEQVASARNLTAQDVAIIVSYSGETAGLLEVAKHLQTGQVPIVSITAHPDSTLARLANCALYARGTTRYFGEIDLSSRVAMMSVFDALLVLYAEKQSETGYKTP